MSEVLSWLLLAASLGITAFALVAWRNSLQPPPRPGELRLLSGTVSGVHHARRRYGGISGVHFGLAAGGPGLYYAGFYPALPWAVDCLRPGASVSVGVIASTSDLWELTCNGRVIADLHSMTEARLANGRYARNLGIAFGLSDLGWVWWILAARSAARRAGPRDRRELT